MVDYDWPGNVRELENEVKKMTLLVGDNVEVTLDILSRKLRENSSGATEVVYHGGPAPASPELMFTEQYSLYDYLAEHEKEFIIRALREKNGVKKHAAALLNIPESTLRLKIKQYGIDLSGL